MATFRQLTLRKRIDPTINLGIGYGRDNWTAEFYVNNLSSEEGHVVQPAGKFTPESSMLRPRTMGLRFGYSF
ncbi:MAG: hypothetical protein CM15mP103_12420 [Gammaproteobacteria bacterium]|nr:MAG: hypothetical protein CM15mP103_12420 [Gammaproteobacteria bacterium]